MNLPGATLLLALSAGSTWAQAPSLPALRPLSTDRPDQTESPYTVDAGHWQIELDFFNTTRDSESGARTDAWNVLPVNVKYGLTPRADLQMIFDSYAHERTRVGAATDTTEDWGDLTFRLKFNVWGNDDDAPTATALGLMPWIKLPLDLGDAGNDRVEGGLIIPLAVGLAEGWGLGLMTEFDAITDEDGQGTHLEWINSITLSHDLTARLGGYVEFFAAISAEDDSDWVGQFDAGLTYGLTDNVQFDVGCNLGVTKSAPDVQPFLGLSVRY